MKAVILASDRGIRRLDSTESTPSSLVEDETGRAVLDYQVEALRRAGVDDILVVAGYHIEKVVKAHPEVDFVYDPEWAEGGNLTGIVDHLDVLEAPCLIASGDAIFHEPAVERLRQTDADEVAGVQTFADKEATRRGRQTLEDTQIVQLKGDLIGGPSELDGPGRPARLTGILKLSEQGLRNLESLCGDMQETGSDDTVQEWDLEDLILHLVSEGVPVKAEILDGDAKRLDGREDVSRFLLGTKADTLDRLQALVQEATVLDQVTFEVRDWKASRGEILERIQNIFDVESLAVRSSALAEDGWEHSAAGAFRTELAVPREDTDQLENVVDRVIQSFAQDREASPFDQVLVQPHLDHIVLSGVAFTRDLDTGGLYTVINYDADSGRTDTITGGTSTHHRTTYLYNDVDDRLSKIQDPDLKVVIEAVDELRRILSDPPLDIEFAVDQDSEVHLLQVRPLTTPGSLEQFDHQDVHAELSSAKGTVEDLDSTRPLLDGSGTVLGVMPDWNPAEMIGTEPDPLACSLYRYLITDDVWAQARAESGYRDVRPASLMVILAGRPYIDTLVDFNSFLPEDLDSELGGKLVDHYVDRLAQSPDLHDKVEFEIVFTCRDFAFDQRADQLREARFTEDEIAELERSLRRLTDDILTGNRAPLENQVQRLAKLGRRREAILRETPQTWSATVRTVSALLDDTRRYGTLPFSIVARYAFIARSFLSSLVDVGILSEKEEQAVLRDIPTIANDIAEGMTDLANDEMDLSTFLGRFGHLRPGSYDITSPRYDEAPRLYFDQSCDQAIESEVQRLAAPELDARHPRAREIFEEHQPEIQELILESGFSFTVEDLFEFVTGSIPLRERAKFEFTKNLSEALKLLSEGAEEHLQLSAKTVAHIPLEDLLKTRAENPSAALARRLERTAGFNQKRRKIQEPVQMPRIVSEADDLLGFEVDGTKPNFVTLESVTAPVLDLENAGDNPDLDGHILLIPSADPGYDWVFGHDIEGLVTQYGGVASHMAIRASEFQLPAAIGCGEALFEEIRSADLIELDCIGEQIQVVR